MPTPLPDESSVDLTPPDATEVTFLARGVVAAIAPEDGLTELQEVLVEAMFEAMTGHPVTAGTSDPIGAEEFAAGLVARNEAFRTRIVQLMILGAMVLRPLPEAVADRVAAFARALSVDDGMLGVARRFAEGSLGLAAFDFSRNGYTRDWDGERASALHASRPLADAWEQSVDDPELAARWQALGDLPAGSLGRRMFEFYEARGFSFPGTAGSAPPLLAQHDWVHLLADYGTKVESELEVFAFIARANDDPRGFSLLAMVVSLFETGYLRTGAGLFEAFPGQLSREGVAVRMADAMRRGALSRGLGDEPDVDFLAVDWFELAPEPIDAVRARFGIVDKGPAAVAAGSVGPWEPGGISEFQFETGRQVAERAGRPHETYGASVG